ncbi:Vacuolar protein-sorting-associated protein 28 [Vermiconidia calcicola]|uniref:Vacuolar protein-sorting-associated protein 28 n=1 Tax=Vermiconidia calcicola TaxID=1690605 RepID=A0ACC3NU97_9PEZI|nr:Vacuolar protein-sorting-associated protein 28 [Vermiconidia calcicola]
MYAQQQLAYAPTPYSYTPSSNLTATINLDEEVRLADNTAERDLYESLAEIYSIIVTLDALEKAYLRDSIKEIEYAETCERLLRQYKNSLADETVASAFGSLEAFKAEWDVRTLFSWRLQGEEAEKRDESRGVKDTNANTIWPQQLEVPRATERLRIGLPATTIEHTHSHLPPGTPGFPSGPSRASFQYPTTSTPAPGVGGGAHAIVSASENFITLFDAIRMNMLSKDTLHPILVEIIQSVNKVTDRDFENKGKIVQWLITLNQMRAAEELSPEQARELNFDLNAAYDGFKGVLE